jgi:hypothetical protein
MCALSGSAEEQRGRRVCGGDHPESPVNHIRARSYPAPSVRPRFTEPRRRGGSPTRPAFPASGARSCPYGTTAGRAVPQAQFRRVPAPLLRKASSQGARNNRTVRRTNRAKRSASAQCEPGRFLFLRRRTLARPAGGPRVVQHGAEPLGCPSSSDGYPSRLVPLPFGPQAIALPERVANPRT